MFLCRYQWVLKGDTFLCSSSQAASSPKLSAPVPENDDDLAPWHYERLIRFAHEVAPSMLSTIPEAWQRFGKVCFVCMYMYMYTYNNMD